ncbi:MAG: hypothetical protein WBC44_07025 [Planctomycetaceae bacterium]
MNPAPTTLETRCDETLANAGGNRGFGSVATTTNADDAFAELNARGLAITITADGGLSVRPARLVDGALADLVRTHRAGLIAIAARSEPDPIRRGLLTGELVGWRHDDEGRPVAGLAPWHADVLGVPHIERKG